MIGSLLATRGSLGSNARGGGIEALDKQEEKWSRR